MIVISSSLVLSQDPGAAFNANNPVIGWRNLVTVNNVAADSEAAGFPALNLANPSTYLLWKSASTAQQYLTVTSLGADPVDYIAVAGHNFGSAQIPLLVQGDDGGGYDDLTSEVLLPDDAPVLFRYSPASFASVRLRLGSGGLAAPFAAVMYVGKLLLLQRRIYVGHRPLLFNTRANTVTGRSELGQFLGRLVLSETTEGALEQQNVSPAFYRTEMEPWRKAGVTRPFFFAWRPGSYPLEVAYCWGTGDMEVSNQRTNGMMQASLNLQGIVK